MIFSKLFDLTLFTAEILRFQDILHPPFITGSGAQHTAHQMIMPVRMRKGMQCIIFIHAEFL